MKVYAFRNKKTGEMETRVFTAIRHVKSHITISKKGWTRCRANYSGCDLIEFDLDQIEGKVVKL